MNYIGVNKTIKNIEIDENKFINKGGYGKVYQLDNALAAKVYYIKFPVKAKKDTKKVLKMVRQLDIPGMYKIFDLLYDKKTLEFKGYTMELVRGTPLSNLTPDIAKKILELSSNRAIDLLVRLENIKYTLSNNNIYMSDDLGSNIFIHDNTFTVTDADSYLYRPQKRLEILDENDDLVNTLEAALPIRCANVLGLSKEETDRIRENSKEIFLDKRNILANKIEIIGKEKTLMKTLLK